MDTLYVIFNFERLKKNEMSTDDDETIASIVAGASTIVVEMIKFATGSRPRKKRKRYRLRDNDVGSPKNSTMQRLLACHSNDQAFCDILVPPCFFVLFSFRHFRLHFIYIQIRIAVFRLPYLYVFFYTKWPKN